jgi:hypothetical protein
LRGNCPAAPGTTSVVKSDIGLEWSQVTKQQATALIANTGPEARDIQIELLSSSAFVSFPY